MWGKNSRYDKIDSMGMGQEKLYTLHKIFI